MTDPVTSTGAAASTAAASSTGKPTAAASTSTSAASTAAAVSAATAKSATVDYNSFLTLMIAELKNQNPTSPSDPTQYMSQLASFSSVEQQVNTNTKLDSMLTANALSQADGVIGYAVSSADGKTSGIVSSVTLGSGGALTATLTNGSTLALGSGVKISAPQAGTAQASATQASAPQASTSQATAIQATAQKAGVS